MLTSRTIYPESPPAMQTRLEINPTLLVSWWATMFSMAIIVVRLCGRYIRVQRFFPEDKAIMISVIPLLIRMALVHFVLTLGTNNTITTDLTEQNIRNRELGSKLVLGARISYTIFIWTAKVAVRKFLERVTGVTWRRSTAIFLRLIDILLLSTFMAVVIATLTECQPFHHYWQVTPDPGPTCRTGYVNLITMGACDIITNLSLIAFPVPIILLAQMPLTRRLILVGLFCSSLLLIGITSYRVPSVISHKGSQQYRSLLASLEILAATAVSNALAIRSFVRDQGVKKPKYKRELGSSISASVETCQRRNTVMQHEWGSDSDLAASLGIRLDSLQRTNPPWDPSLTAHTGSLDFPWGSPNTRSDAAIKTPHEYLRTNGSPRAISARPFSLQDVGSLLTTTTPGSCHTRASTISLSIAPFEKTHCRVKKASFGDLRIVPPDLSHSMSKSLPASPSSCTTLYLDSEVQDLEIYR